ncbi:ATP-binding cassette domain-containing protein [Streptomyces sp. NPDC058424]|uniref:branched-chain amino acid ABC transporter ATP-binding protein/permease n=1 Tax=Streptomyces sp. NPDC058424 TaxID=3346491 RepID=UPI00365906F2
MTDMLSVFGAYDFAVRDALVLSLVALAIHVLLNAGIFAVPQVGLMAVGAYTSAVLSVDAGTPFPVSVVCGALAASVAALGLAALLGRLHGIYLAISSIAFSEIVRVAVLNLPLTGGSQGKVGIPREADDLLICATVVAAVVGLTALRRSRAGLVIAALRVDPLMARHQGVDVVRYRTGLFALSGLLAGTAGALHVHMTGFVEPGQFDFALLTRLLAVVVIGGMAYVSGSFVGAAVIFGLPFTLSALADYQIFVNGALIVLMVAFAPGGILGLLAGLRTGRDRRTTARTDTAASAWSPSEPPPAPTPAPAPTGPRAKVIEVNAVSMHFGGLAALDGVALTACEGEILGLIGPNGSGKTTLLNVLSGVHVPTSGQGTLLDSNLARLWGKPHRLADVGIARTFQTIRLMDTSSALVNVALGVPVAEAHGRMRRAGRLLDEHGLAGVADTLVGELPYGVRRRVEIVRALARRPRLLLLDEPTAGMNPEERQQVFDTVAEVRASGVAVIVVEHDVATMRAFCDRLLVLDFGRVLAEGAPEEVLNSKEVIRAYIGSGALA